MAAKISRLLSTTACVLCSAVSMTGLAHAQSVPPAIAQPPIRSPIDANGVNLATGGLELSTTELSIGVPGQAGLAHTRMWTGNGWRHGNVLTITTDTTGATVSIGAQSTRFDWNSGSYVSAQGDGSTLTYTASEFTYTARDGTIVTFDRSFDGYKYYDSVGGVGTRIVLPSGERLALSYDKLSMPGPGGSTVLYARLLSVRSTTGFQLKFEYGSAPDWMIIKVTAINNAFEYCGTTATPCPLTQNWPTVQYSQSIVGSDTRESVIDALGRVTRYTMNPGKQITAVKRPSSSVDDITFGYDGNGRVASVGNANATWGYAWTLSGTTLTATISDPYNFQRVTTADTTKLVLLTDKDPLNRITTYQHDGNGRLTYFVPPEGTISGGTPTAGYTRFDYDPRGNLTTTTRVSKTPGTPANIVTSAAFPSNCTNLLTCNKPTSTTDARGLVTDYAYDAGTGFLTSVTAPAPSGGSPRPQTRYSYAPWVSFYKQASGGAPVAAPNAISKLVRVSSCSSTASCANSADEVRTEINYGPQATGTPNNLLPVVVGRGAGDGSLVANTTMTYDMVGNLYTLDGPLADADISRYRFDAGRQLTGVVGPDPDGGGALKHRAIRTTYNSDGQPTLIEQGTVNSQSDADWSTFSTLEREVRGYDNLGRLRLIEMPGPTSSQRQVTQLSYDDENRPLCVASRMTFYNASDTLPADPCNHYTPGPYGPDRIVKYTYTAADELSSVIEALGTPQQRAARTMTYTGNGLAATLKDAKNNLTTYEYDGFDRLTKVRYPSPTAPGSSSTTDYEQYDYDPASNVTQERRRSGALIGFGYDNLNRVTSKNLPGGEPDVTFGYDLLGRATSMSSSVASLGFQYDQLGRTKRATGPQGSTDYQYDLAGRRARLTWPDGFYVTYDYLLTGEITAVRENGAASGVGVLASFTYDNLGRRISLTRGNGTVTGYSYDAGSRLQGLSQDLAGTGFDQAQGFSYNPGVQITQQTRSNDAYAFTESYDAARSYTVNGLNQYTQAGAAAPTYDAGGNLTSLWGDQYGYSSENLLVAGPAAVGLSYDPAMRLYQLSASSVTRFGYDGPEAIAEYDGANALQRRTVFGPGIDEPLVWYEGAGTGSRRWLHADERGSVTAISDASGNALGVNSYDDHGMPSSRNLGRYQYTGQMWLSELGQPPAGLYHYRARAYSPRLGRFMQPDPIGTAGGMNLYAYAGNDPVNRLDPSGTQDLITVIGSPIFDSWAFSWFFDFNPGFFGPFYPPIIGGDFDLPDDVQAEPEITVPGRRAAPHSIASNPFPIDVVLSGATTADMLAFAVAVSEGQVVPQNPKPKPCIKPTDGPVGFTGGGLDLVLGVGGGVGFYKFSIPSTGASGWVASGAGLGGVGGSLGFTKGRVSNFGSFTGFGWRVDVELPIPGVGGELIFNDDEQHVGHAGSFGAGGGLYGGRTKTRVLSSNIPVCPVGG